MRTRRVISIVDAHAGGDASRIVVGGGPALRGATMFEKMQDLARNADWLRRLIIQEPRGAPHMSGVLVLPPLHPGTDVGVIFMESVGYPPMSGSNAMCAVTVILETGIVAMREPETRLVLDTPGGPVPVIARCRDGRCVDVRFENVPAVVTHLGHSLHVSGFGAIPVDIAYGGVFHVIVEARALGLWLTREEIGRLLRVGRRVTRVADRRLSARHPGNPDIGGIRFSIFSLLEATEGAGGVATRCAVYQEPGLVCRSPTGTGASARLAAMHARGEIGVGELMISRSVIGSRFDAEILGTVALAGRTAVRTAVTGQAWITGMYQILLDPEDPFPEGFLVGA
ncbi:MAG: proline racemase family protein [Gammaproteobacteria bacterium]|nr:proline racemase family protein [Gammaproteobacteria bacterium]NIR83716.1 proline racemase family protein [Gammaproteobacteria bacterium]NIR91863.1 proline racemase family protein [Gammaproteobacteria bacterium]NIU04882.1 proline racemase family protein [Gammaproteobacteria bacterium]NIV51864.1 hypothetical protein [Gammaproteobacteria bacterium]